MRMLILLLAISLGPNSAIVAGVKPNIVLILGDDMGIDAVRAFNDKLGLKTPHLDRLVKEGMSFMDAHSSSAVCSPTRYGLLTGRYHWRSRLKRGIVGRWERPLIAEDRLTLPAMLRQHGYATTMIGKWHLGHHWPKKGGGLTEKLGEIDFSAPIKGGPTDRGFDYWFGDDVPNWPPYAWRENDRLLGKITTTAKALGLKGVSDGPAVADWNLEAVLPEYAKRCSQYILDQEKSDQPFFLYFPMPSPHAPIVPSDKWKGKSGVSEYADFLLETDWAVGELLKALDQSGQADNTLVIFTTDNGTSPKANFSELDAKAVHLAEHWRGCKADAFEGGHRVPFVIRWPGKIKPGARKSETISLVDIMATLAEMVGHDLPDNAAEDSTSLLPLLRGHPLQAPLHEAVVCHSISGHFALRSGKWKILYCQGSGGWSSPREAQARKLKLPSIQLYDLETDPKETTNLYKLRPEVVSNLTAILRRYVEEGRSTPGALQSNHAGINHWNNLPWAAPPVTEPTAKKPAAGRKPNIVFILADDLGIGDLNCYGGDRCLIETPHIDALAAGGLRFTDAHVNASVCGPTRRAIMTGRYNWRFGSTVNHGPWGFCGPRPNTEKSTLGKLLKRAGYETGYVGKWHLGTVMTTRDGKTQGLTNVDFTKPLKYGPVQFGFDHSFILPGSLDMYPYAYARNNLWQGEVTAQKGWSAFNRVGPSEKNFKDHEVLETFYSEAESFLRVQKKDRPFFLFLALTAPHTPTSPGVNWRGKSKLGVYGDFVMEVDHSVERVMKALKEQGLDKNTLLIFSSDHGPAPYAGNILKATPGQIKDLEAKGHYCNGPHRGYKFSVYEGGLRVPLIARWPGVIAEGETCEALVGLNDFMATVAELTDGEMGNHEGPDSISFAKLLRRPKARGTRQTLVMQSVVSFAVREGSWKLCLCPGSGVAANSPNAAGNLPSPEDAWRIALNQFPGEPKGADLLRAPFVQLFDLANDPHEDKNLAANHPERVANMVALLKKQIANGRSTPGPRLKNDKNVRIVNLNDKRLPAVVRKRIQQARLRP